MSERATTGGSVPEFTGSNREGKRKPKMLSRGVGGSGRKLDLRKSNNGRNGNGSEGELTRFLHRVVGEVVQLQRKEKPSQVDGVPSWDDFDFAEEPEAAPEPSWSAAEVAAALPKWKRALDLAIIMVTFPLWLPVLTLMAIWVAATSPGPIFYRQPRVGFKGRRFMILKLRTMKVNAETHVHESYLEHLMVTDRPMIKLDATGDPRLIPGAKILRATGLDELPQIFNVLNGEMSIVGPRPCTVREFERLAPEYRARSNAFPGMTGFWQVNGKNRTTFRQMIEMDIFYTRNVSPWLDVRIILRTLPALAVQCFDSWQSIPSPTAGPAPSVKNLIS